MTDDEDTDERVVETEARASVPETPAWVTVTTWIVRGLTRLWVICLILFAAAFAGISVYQLGQSHAALNELRQAPGADAYAVVAYRHELARQIRAYRRNWRNSDAVPIPPDRPLLLEETDLARARNAEFRRPATPSSGQPGGGPPP